MGLFTSTIDRLVERNTVKFERYLGQLETASEVLHLVTKAVDGHLSVLKILQPRYAEMNRRFYAAVLTGDTLAVLDWLDAICDQVAEHNPLGTQLTKQLVQDLRERYYLAHDLPFTKAHCSTTATDASAN